MSAPLTEPSIGPALWRIAGHLFFAGIAFIGGWFLWDWARYDLWMFNIYAALFALGGVIRLRKALVELVQLLWKRRNWAKYQAKGAAPKADSLAAQGDLKRRGLVK